MLRPENRMMKRLSLSFGCFAVLSMFAFVISQAKNGNGLSAPVNGSTGKLVMAVQQAPVAAGIGAYTAAGLPVSLAIGALKGGKGFNELPCRISLASISEARRVNLALFEIEPSGKLLGAEGWTQTLDPASVKTDDRTGAKVFDFDLRLHRLLTEKNAFVITLELVSGPAGTWETDFSELLQTVVARASGNTDAQSPVRQSPDQNGGDYGSNHCARAFGLATYLSRFSQSAGMPSFSCDQQLRNFSFAYASFAKTAASAR